MLAFLAAKKFIISPLKRFASDEQGATAIEYGLIAAMMCVALVASAIVLSGSFDAMWAYVETNLVEALEP